MSWGSKEKPKGLYSNGTFDGFRPCRIDGKPGVLLNGVEMANLAALGYDVKPIEIRVAERKKPRHNGRGSLD